MTTTRIKEKISKIVASQLPEFIRSDFTTFVSFIEAYYRFLEQDQEAYELIQNIRSYNDIDLTIESFVKYFIANYASIIPESTLADKKLLVKKIKDLYESKGSELSFKLIFSILFDTDVEVRYPYENVLRVSAGKWQQNFSIRVETLTGSRDNLVNRLITHTANGIVYKTPITRIKNLTPNLTELFLDANFLSSEYNVDDIINVFEGTTLVFSGVIQPTTVSYRIDQAGTGFKVGQIFNITAVGTDTLIKITKINSVGGITEFKIISYGYGYEADPGSNIFTVLLDKDSNVSLRQTNLTSRTSGFGSSGLVLKSDPSSPERYFLEDYTDDPFYTITEIAATFNNDAFSFVQDQTIAGASSNLAIIVFTLGALAKYPGQYVSDQSFISELEVRIQDDKLYQPFAYQTNTVVDLEIFTDIIKKVLNPAGQVLYNNRLLQQNLSLFGDLDLELDRKIFINLHDSTKYLDQALREVNTFNDLASTLDFEYISDFFKNLSDVEEVLEESVYLLNKNLSDNQILNDEVFSFNTNKPLEDLIDSIELLSQSLSRFLDDFNTVDDFNFYNFNKQQFDQTNTEDQLLNLQIQNNQLENVQIFEEKINNISKTINTDDNKLNLLDNGTIDVTASTYTLEEYFAELYVADPPSTTLF